jgi:O-antigen ligase
MTAVFATGLSILLMIWARLIQRSPNMMIALTTLGITFSVLLLFFALNISSLEDAFAVLGKKAGMSGRFPLWEQVIVFIGEKPIIGYGYEAFWHEDAPETRFVASVIKYMPFYSHNGVLEVLLNGGLLLLGLVTSFIIIGTYRAFRFARYYRKTFIATFPLVFMGYFILANISESHLLMRNDLVWSLALGVAFRLALDESIFRQERYYAKP